MRSITKTRQERTRQVIGRSLQALASKSGVLPCPVCGRRRSPETYKKTIQQALAPDIYSKKPIRVGDAKKALAAYKLAVGDLAGETELMVYFVETGNDFTIGCGDLFGAYYEALMNMYGRAIKNVRKMPERDQESFKERLDKIMTSCAGMGWRYGDGICEM